MRPAARVGEWLWSFIHKHFCCPSGMSSWEERKGEVNRDWSVYYLQSTLGPFTLGQYCSTEDKLVQGQSSSQAGPG